MGPHRKKSIEIAGTRFTSLAAAAKKYGIADRNLLHRINVGWTPEQAVGLEQAPSREGKSLTVGSKRFANTKDAATAYGVSPSTVSQRLKKGWSTLQALGIIDPPKRKRHHFAKGVELNGKNYESLTELAKEYGINVSSVYFRLKHGWPIEQAAGIDPPPSPNGGKKLCIHGKEFASISKAAAAYGIHAPKVRDRLRKGWTVEQALEIEAVTLANDPIKLCINGQEYRSISQAIRELGVSRSKFYSRRKMGWSIEQALGIDPADD